MLQFRGVMSIGNDFIIEDEIADQLFNFSTTESFPYLEVLPSTKKKKTQSKPCRDFYCEKIRKETQYFRGQCEENPPLIDSKCFREYHMGI